MPEERANAAASRATAAPVVGLAVAGLVIAGLATSARLNATASLRPADAATALHAATGVAFLITGAIAAARRRRNRVGLLMVGVGLSWFVIDLQVVPWSVAYTLGNVFGIVTWGVLAQLALGFPGGRLEDALDRGVVVAVYAWMVLGNVLTEMFFAAPAAAGAPHQLLVVHTDAAQHAVASKLQLGVNILLGVVALAVLIGHWRGQSRLRRRALSPVMWASAPIFGAVLAIDAVGLVAFPGWLSSALPEITPLAVLTLPIAFLVGLVRSNLARLAVGHLVVEIGRASTPDEVRTSLSRAVGDPTLTLAYRVPDADRWVDPAGRPVTLPARDSGRSCTLLERDGEVVAALVHDRILEDHPALVASVAATASLALERERLQAEVRAQLLEVRASRARIVQAADDERRRLQRDLHDGAQQRLVALAMRLSQVRDIVDGALPEAAAALADASEQLRSALRDLRELSSGIHPR
ncbi:MAG TPA: histidine kinase, partial [Candidatus Dormibacteraeota bacterium]